MAAYAPATDKLVTSSTGNLKDALPLDARDMLSRLLIDMGLLPLIVGNTPPSNRDDLWFHKDVRQVKRYDGVLGNWYQATPNQIAMHIARRAVLGSVTEINLETGDLFTFWDTSQGDVKVISRDNLIIALGALRTITTTEGIQGGGTLGANRTLRLDFSALSTKASLSGDDQFALYSTANNAHRKVSFEDLASSIASYNVALNFFLGGK